VERPDNLAPREWAPLCIALDVLPEEEQEAPRIIISRASMFLDHTYAFNNICKPKLLTT
jgi:hypothetical protein